MENPSLQDFDAFQELVHAPRRTDRYQSCHGHLKHHPGTWGAGHLFVHVEHDVEGAHEDVGGDVLGQGSEPVEEVLVATDPDVEGDATALYLARLVRPSGVKVTRLAHGVSVGTELEFADKSSVARALENRREI